MCTASPLLGCCQLFDVDSAEDNFIGFVGLMPECRLQQSQESALVDQRLSIPWVGVEVPSLLGLKSIILVNSHCLLYVCLVLFCLV